MRNIVCGLLLGALIGTGGLAKAAEPDILIADFEGKDYGSWVVTGEAFGPGPSQGGFSNQMAVSGYEGHGLVDSYFHGDDTTGTLTSPEFTLSRKYINFLCGGGNHPGLTCVNLLIDGKVVRSTTGPDSERLYWATWDISDLQGKHAQIQIVDNATGGWGHINVDQIAQSDARKAPLIKTSPLYQETYRPQFHFTSQKNWLNDPNGLSYDQGEFHLFFQYDPNGNNGDLKIWGHAVSTDLVHWKEIQHAIEDDAHGAVWSGSAVVDEKNTSGFQRGSKPPLIAFYTAAGGTTDASRGQEFTQRLLFSNDRGRTFTPYIGNPIIPHIMGGNRDPKVVWYAPTKHWILALFLDNDIYALFSSPDLKKWTEIQRLHTSGHSECPDFFEMPLQGKPGVTKWVFTSADGNYWPGTFDGQKFTPEQEPLREDWGANYYAVQTYSHAPDGRRIQIAWMAGGSYPQMPFNQQMSFPCDLTLHQTPDGLRLYRWPVPEIKNIYDKEHRWRNQDIKPGDNPLAGLSGELWDIQAEFELKDAASFGFKIRGEAVTYSVKDQTLSALGRSAALSPDGNRVRIRVLVDRTSIEAFGGAGSASLTSCFVPNLDDRSLACFAEGGTVKLVSLSVHSLRSIWPNPPGTASTAAK